MSNGADGLEVPAGKGPHPAPSPSGRFQSALLSLGALHIQCGHIQVSARCPVLIPAGLIWSVLIAQLYFQWPHPGQRPSPRSQLSRRIQDINQACMPSL